MLSVLSGDDVLSLHRFDCELCSQRDEVDFAACVLSAFPGAY